MLSIYFCSCLTQTQKATGTGCTCPEHLCKGEPSGQSHFTGVKCLRLISRLLSAHRILLISLREQGHVGVCFFCKSQLLQQPTFFYMLAQRVRKEASSVSDFNQATSSF